MRTKLRGGLNLFLICVLTGSLSCATLPYNYESLMKETYLCNFSRLMAWPKSAFESPHAPIRICVLGKTPFVEDFDLRVKGKEINGRTIKVQHLGDFKQANTCHTLFISQSEKEKLAEILAYTQQYPILTVGHIDDFVTQGGMIQFYDLRNTIRFLVDFETVDEAGITISIDLFRDDFSIKSVCSAST